MKIRYLLFIIFLMTVFRANAQAPKTSENRTVVNIQKNNKVIDTIVNPGDTCDVMKSEDSDRTTIKWWQFRKLWQFYKKSENNDGDCKECEEKLKELNQTKENLETQVNDLNARLVISGSVFSIDDKYYYQDLFTSALKRKYDPSLVDCHKKTVAIFDYKNKKEMKWVYDVYYPLLENYGKYNEEIARLIKNEIILFEWGNPDIEAEKDSFNNALENSEYYREYRYMGINSKNKEIPSRKIQYLEDVINDTKALFEDPSKFTKENFEKQRMKLVSN
ncbi:MAG: hypothetical protein IKM85_04815 [Bacteroidales bacterium]|nr:hypothetical protein [Bacteroidales bacterium]